ncbi:MAG TPA: magnesium transporter [archaeon]|nr:magnesium transporter [archaeon]
MNAKTQKGGVAWTIIRQSFFFLVIASAISSIGGFGLEGIKANLFAIVPLIVIVPALADFVGDFATVITAHFSTMFYTGKKLNLRNWRHDPEVMDLLVNVFKVSMICAVYIGALASLVVYKEKIAENAATALKVMLVSVTVSLVLISAVIGMAGIGSYYVHSLGWDPDNTIIPLTTAVADLSSLLLLAAMVKALF